MSGYERPLLPCGHDAHVHMGVAGERSSCSECGEPISDFDMERLVEENQRRIDAAAPAPIKPPRRMLQPTKDQLRERIAVLETMLDEATHGIEIMNRQLEASREAYQQLWANTWPAPEPPRHERIRFVWLEVTIAFFRAVRADFKRRMARHKDGGLTSFEIHDKPSTEEALRVASQRLGERAVRSMPTEELRHAIETAHRQPSQVAPDPDHPQGQGDSQAQPETAQTTPPTGLHPPESGHKPNTGRD